ncbi:mitochondrial carrier domain-containing protein [Pavlovales sp. CCMP2436]|nr:mitochondrial carrier domain-containing protein [Pavlovales sp. CCMP2436]|mmetsp:Transcript_41144/g.101554  ORF Transcript_41144/g.101554 Transcript_41144/m.101554 type:complete len:303 (+) Transcript_41144:67-975(+)
MAETYTSWELAGRFASTSASCCIADGLCLPLDFVKTRMQLQNEMLSSSAPRLGVVGMGSQILRTEGVLAFYSGFAAAMLRQATYGGLCFGSYPLIRDAISPTGDPKSTPLWARIAAGGSAGAVASAFANPTDVVKVRLQADGRLAAMGEQPRYRGTIDAIRRITREEGARAFYKGVGPNVQRATVVNGIGIASYDQSKQTVVAMIGEDESLLARFLAALVGGIATALVGCPFDVLKTRMMNQPVDRPLYTSAGQCALVIVRIEGPLALWKGLLPVYCRQAPFNVLNYLIMEQLTLALIGKSM